MASFARWCFTHRIAVVLIWVFGLVGLLGAVKVVGNAYTNEFALPGTESRQALDLLKEQFPAQSGASATIVWHVDEGSVRDREIEERIAEMLTEVSRAPGVSHVASPYDRSGDNGISPNGRTAYATVTFDKSGFALPKAEVEQVIGIAEKARSSGLEVELGGQTIQRINEEPTSKAEAIGLLAAAVVLLIAFGSFLSMLLPLATAILSLATAEMSIALLSHASPIATFAPTVAALIGLGVGIDYALFIVTRHRNGIKAGMSVEESAVRALNTSGRAVIFAGLTVCVAMLGLLVLGLSFLTGVGIAAAAMVFITVLVSTTLLPAMLGFVGTRVLSRRERRRLVEDGPHDPHGSGLWVRWAEFVRAHPVILTPIALLVMLVIALPVFSLHLGSSDAGNDAASTTTRKSYDLLAEGFGPGSNGPLQLVAEVGSPADAAALKSLTKTLSTTPGVAAVVPMPSKPGASVAIIQVVPTSSPQDIATSELIEKLRVDVIPRAERGTTLQVFVGGQTAMSDDFATVIAGKLPLFIGVIVGLGFLLLLIAFRSIVVPLTAAIMNLLAAGASFGVVVAFFQWGWGSELLGLGKAGPVESFLPVMMLAILFGLSMDYQVFLVSRMHEEWVHTHDNARSVTVGQASTGRVITAAATIMICVFLAFVFAGQRIVAEFGVGLAAAVFIDAFILRTVLVPALMHLFGRANWWLPGWIDGWLPHLSVEPAEDEVPIEQAATAAAAVAAPKGRAAEPEPEPEPLR